MSTFPETRKTTLRRRNEFQFETYDLISIFLVRMVTFLMK